MATTYKPFKLSELSSIENIDHEDLMLVSDYENGACFTKKMTIEQLLNSFSYDPILTAAISSQVQNMIKAEVQRQVLENLSSNVLNIISSNHEFVVDSLDGKIDGTASIVSLVSDNSI